MLSLKFELMNRLLMVLNDDNENDLYCVISSKVSCHSHGDKIEVYEENDMIEVWQTWLSR